MVRSSWLRGCDAVTARVRRLSSGRALRRCALAVAIAVAALTAAPADAKPSRRSGSGAGAIVEYQTSSILDGRSITATVQVFVVVPRNESLPTYLAVGVKEVDDGTGDELFSGTGTGAPGKFTVGRHFARAHLTGQIMVQSGTPGATRIADVDVVWNPEDPTQKIKIRPQGGGPDDETKELHKGRVRRMTGVGLVRISDPDRTDYVFTITDPGLGAAWNTKDTSRDVAPFFGQKSGSSASGPDAIAASSSGYWTGYWTWRWDGTKWASFWTWVYVQPSGGWATS